MKRQVSKERQEWLQRVLDYAYKHYEDGWDAVIECATADDLQECMTFSKSYTEALKSVWRSYARSAREPGIEATCSDERIPLLKADLAEVARQGKDIPERAGITFRGYLTRADKFIGSRDYPEARECLDYARCILWRFQDGEAL